MQASSIFLTEYTKIITSSDIIDQDLGVQIAFPRFQEDLILKLLDETLSILKNLSLIYFLETNLYIVGDLHGNIRDLIRILRQVNFFGTEARILFLGDYVDRGEFSLEVVTLLFSLICQFPDRIYLLRGNHEFSNINMHYGFKNQMRNLYGNDNLWFKFNTVFNYLPISAIIDKTIFCVHGGISPHINSVYQIEVMEKPILTFNYNSLLTDLMWSDPSTSVTFFLESERGFGCIFGQDAVFEFCRNQKMDKIIRSHQCVKSGVESLFYEKVLTVFSCSNYCNKCNNDAGFIHVNKEKIEKFTFHPLQILNRENALFIEYLRKSEDDIEKVDVSSGQNLALASRSGPPTGLALVNNSGASSVRKRVLAKRKSSFSQSFTKKVSIPLASVHIRSNEHFSNKRPAALTRSSQVFALNDDDRKNKASNMTAVKGDVKSHVPSLPPIDAQQKKVGIPPLPLIGDDRLQSLRQKNESESDDC